MHICVFNFRSIVVLDLHAHGRGPTRDALPNTTQAEDPQSPASGFDAHGAVLVPFACSELQYCRVEESQGTQHEEQRRVGRGVVDNGFDVGDLDPGSRACRDVNGVVACAFLGSQLFASYGEYRGNEACSPQNAETDPYSTQTSATAVMRRPARHRTCLPQ